MARKTPAKSRKSPRKPVRKFMLQKPSRKVDFNDEEAVLKEVCKELDLDPSDCQISSGTAPNGYGSAYTITTGHLEYIVMENDDEFEAAARNGVESDLRDDPSNFDSNFIESHINLDRLRDALHSDVSDSNFDALNDEAERHPMDFLKDNNIDIPPPSEKQLRDHAELESNDEKSADEIYDDLLTMDPEEQWDAIGEEPEVAHSDITDAADELATAQLKDPMEYLTDMYGRNDAPKKAIEIAGIDVEKAADEVVSTDGAAHFMCGYDGKYDTTKSGFIVWRHN
jgi:hypothetical protein